MRVLLTFAVEPEFAALRKLREFETCNLASSDVVQRADWARGGGCGFDRDGADECDASSECGAGCFSGLYDLHLFGVLRVLEGRSIRSEIFWWRGRLRR